MKQHLLTTTSRKLNQASGIHVCEVIGNQDLMMFTEKVIVYNNNNNMKCLPLIQYVGKIQFLKVQARVTYRHH